VSRIVKIYNFSFLLILFIFYFLVIYKYNYSSPSQNNNKTDAKYYLVKGEQLEILFPDSAIYYYQLGLKGFGNKAADESILKIDLLNRIGKIFHQQSKYAFSNDYYSRALIESELISHDSLTAESHFNIAEINLENGSYSKAIDAYNKSIELFEKINNTEGEYWCNIGLGIVYREVGNSILSKRHYELAKKIGEDEKREDYVAISYNNLGNLYKQLGEYDKAIELLQLALTSFEKFGEERFISDAFEGMGEVYAEINNHVRAIEYFNQSINIAESLGDNYRLLSRYANIAKSYAASDDKEKALMYFSKTTELAQSVGDKSRLSEVLIMIADFYKLSDDYKNALLNLNKSLLISKEVGDTVSIASALNSLSEIYFQKKDYKKAYQSAFESYTISSQKNLMNTVAKSSFSISRILEIQGNHKDALYYYRIHNKTQDILLNSEKLRILEDTEAKYNLEKIEREKLEFENISLLNEEKVQRRNNLILALIIGMLLSVGGGSWYIYKRNKEKSTNAQKALEMKDKIELLNTQLSEKNRELTSKALIISKNNEVLKDVVESIEDNISNSGNDRKELNRLKIKLQEIYEEKSWADFLHHFEQVHPKFYKNLISQYSDLSSMEQKICAFIKMNLNTKDISQITGQSIKAIEVMRSRIRKKLKVPHEESLSKAIQNI
jgi:tetratricopeptide (TPR) repeat protein